ncbi:T9SS type B sorting domain-containing protein, partial [Flavobacterium sp. GT3R68]|uniref:T9SS type B sorting domain-containing protein n=1 Tax=Flavobacterium sp. GT3R68 TaxID=2594437 RepID=UPI001187112E
IESSTGNNTICVQWGSDVLLSGLTLDSGVANPSDYTFQWFLNGNLVGTGSTYSITATTPMPWEGDYTVVATSTSALGCVSLPSDPFQVVQAGPPVAQDPPYEINNFFSDNQIVTILVNGYGYYHYSMDNGPRLDNGGVFENVGIGNHTVMVYDVEGDCGPPISIDVVTVNYPTFFTPNGDGIHDTWNIIGFKPENNAKIYIFDRYGKLLKQLSPINSTGWDGTFNGQPLFSTDYWFTVDYTEKGANKVFKAHFSLKR